MDKPLTQAQHAALLMQQGGTSVGYLRESWTEDQLLALPDGEHDYFERKSGELLERDHWSEKLANSLSAFANSGGGHIILGQRADNSIDGVSLMRGRTSVADWLEDVIPNLVAGRVRNLVSASRNW